MENWREAVCYLKTRHRLLARLYLPFILLNIYKRYDTVGIFFDDPHDLDNELYGIFHNQGVKKGYCLHTFENSDNFAHQNDQIIVLDYGEYGFQEIVEKCGDQVEKALFDRMVKK